jgi:hypothetical protein
VRKIIFGLTGAAAIALAVPLVVSAPAAAQVGIRAGDVDVRFGDRDRDRFDRDRDRIVHFRDWDRDRDEWRWRHHRRDCDVFWRYGHRTVVCRD